MFMECSSLENIVTGEQIETIGAFAYKDCFIPQGSVASLQKQYGVSCEEIQDYIEKLLK